MSREKRDQLKAKLRQLNDDLTTITHSSLQLAPGRRKLLKIKEFDNIRKDACSVHDALEKGPWNCKCKLPHNANLRLDSLEAQPQSISRIALPHRFRIIFSFPAETTIEEAPPWNWREADIVPLGDEAEISKDCASSCQPPAVATICMGELSNSVENDERCDKQLARTRSCRRQANRIVACYPAHGKNSRNESSGIW